MPMGHFERAAAGRPCSCVFEKITILFFSRIALLAATSGPERSNHAGGFSHALMRNYRRRDYREGRERVYCFAVGHADGRGRRTVIFKGCRERISDFCARGPLRITLVVGPRDASRRGRFSPS